MTLLAKVVTFCRADGFAHTADYFWRCLASWCGLRVSETLFFRREGVVAPRNDNNADACEFIMVSSVASLEKHEYPRLRYLPCQKWFSHGSICFVGLLKGKVVSYCWVHNGSYAFGKIGRFKLRDDEAWIGPVFVDKRYRRRGINTAQINCALHELGKVGKRVFFTATNSRNYGSIKSFVGCGFGVVGISRRRAFCGRRISDVVCELSDQQFLRGALM